MSTSILKIAQRELKRNKFWVKVGDLHQAEFALKKISSKTLIEELLSAYTKQRICFQDGSLLTLGYTMWILAYVTLKS